MVYEMEESLIKVRLISNILNQKAFIDIFHKTGSNQ